MARKLETKVSDSQRTATGARLYELRHRMEWSQREIAERFGVSPDTIVKWEMGKRNMSGPAVKLLEVMEREGN